MDAEDFEALEMLAAQACAPTRPEGTPYLYHPKGLSHNAYPEETVFEIDGGDVVPLYPEWYHPRLDFGPLEGRWCQDTGWRGYSGRVDVRFADGEVISAHPFELEEPN